MKIDSWKDQRMAIWMYVCMYEWMGGWMDGLMNESLDVDRWIT